MPDSFLDSPLVDLHRESDAIIHRYGQRLSTSHLAQARGQYQPSSERSAEVFLGHRCERFVRPLKYPLRSNVRPRTSSHLSVHDETLQLEFVEVIPCCPFRNNHAVNDQYSRSQSVSLENRDRLAALNEKGLILAKFF